MRKWTTPVAITAAAIVLPLMSPFVGAAFAQTTTTAIHNTTNNTSSTSPFVTRSGTHLYLKGMSYRFHGFNIYNANSNGSTCWYAMNTGSALSSTIAAIGKNGSAFRAWFFQNQATTNGVRDWTNFDHTLAAAKAAGVKVIPVLINQWGQCEGDTSYAAGYKSESWYQSGYKTQPTSPGMADTYRTWVKEVVSRYKNDPTILAWQMVNEAEDKAAYGGSCSSTAAASLQKFAADIASVIKSNDPNHLVSIGTLGTGQCGSSGSAYKTLYATPGVDLCEYHDYSTATMPGDQWNGLKTRISQCAQDGKPLFVGESGIKTSSVGSLSARATLFQQKFAAQFSAGVVGELMWDWRDASHGGSSTSSYEVGPTDPALAILGTI